MTRLFLSILLILISTFDSAGQIRYFRTPTLPLKADTTLAFLAVAEDSIANDTLFQMRSKEGFPVAYFRKIRTSVCFDNKCRLLKVTLFWNPTGRYLGFDLVKGEFLSKAEHKPFTPAEYERMSDVLADQFSPLATLAYAEIAPPKKPISKEDEVDGVSSATAKNVLDYVVEGAAYTTYKMWHVVYGPTQADVVRLTEESLSPEYVLALLESPDGSDKIWVLNHIQGFVTSTPTLQQKLFTFINGTNYNLTERAVNALDVGPTSTTWQATLADKLTTKSYALQKLIVNKFKRVTSLDRQAKKSLAEGLKSPNSELVSTILDVFRQHSVADLETCRQIADLLTSQNNFIAQKAFTYLEKLPLSDAVIKTKLTQYAQKK